MSNQTIAYDAIVSVLDEIMPAIDGWTRIPYAYDLIKNDDNFLRQGYGVVVGAASRVDLEWCNLAFTRSITVVITREVFNTGSNDVQIDDIAKQLLEDIYKVQDRFNNPDQILAEANIVKIDPTDSSGVEQVESDKLTFLTMEASFDFTIQEPV